MFHKLHPQVGSRPGTLIIGPDAQETRIRVVEYSHESLHDYVIQDTSDLPQRSGDGKVRWIIIQGFRNESALQHVAEVFGIHPLAMEDVINVPQNPKTELYGDQLLIITRFMVLSASQEVHVRQGGMILGPDYVITFQDQHNDLLKPVHERLAYPHSRLRRYGASYLAYAIVDTVIDLAYPVLEELGERLERLERQVMENPRPQLLQQVNMIRNQVANARRTTWPQREAVQRLLTMENELIDDEVKVFLRDTYDHCVQTSEVVEMYRELSSGLINTYMSAVAHRSNEVMKVLTIMSSIFVPLTFLAGIYGMNFEHMPELGFAWSYPMVWAIMLLTAGSMIYLFCRKGWISLSEFFPERNGTDNTSSCSPSAPTARMRVLDHDLPADRYVVPSETYRRAS